MYPLRNTNTSYPIRMQSSSLKKPAFSGAKKLSSDDTKQIPSQGFHIEKTIGSKNFEKVESALSALIHNRSFKAELALAKKVKLVGFVTKGNPYEGTLSVKIKDKAFYKLFPQNSQENLLTPIERMHPLFEVSMKPKWFNSQAVITVNCQFSMEQLSSTALSEFLSVVNEA